MEYGLIGKTLQHSFSKQIHEALGYYAYALCELPDEDAVARLLEERAFRGINVTIPYKQTVLPLCDALDESARAIGAVNTIVNRGGVLTGYNTDFAGCRWALRHAGISLAGKTVLILGSGGTQKTFVAVAKAEGAARILCASRTPKEDSTGTWLTYSQLAQHPEIQVLLNATPAGMYPHNGECLVDLQQLPRLEAVFDAIYNPFATALLQQAAARGCTTANGLSMLVAQAKYAAEYFMDETIQIEDFQILRVTALLQKQLGNLVLIGMPGCGKSTLGRAAAKALGKRFVDLDTEIEAQAKKTIPALFAQEGEEAFRALESRMCAQWGKETGCVLCPGGGAVLRAENLRALAQNATVVYVRRPLSQLATAGRPLSQGGESRLAQLYAQRAPLYEAAAQAVIDNNGSVTHAVQAILEAYDEAAGD